MWLYLVLSITLLIMHVHIYTYRYLKEHEIPSEKCLDDPMLCAGDALERISRPQVSHFLLFSFFLSLQKHSSQVSHFPLSSFFFFTKALFPVTITKETYHGTDFWDLFFYFFFLGRRRQACLPHRQHGTPQNWEHFPPAGLAYGRIRVLTYILSRVKISTKCYSVYACST
jgi:hypothetical protein